MSDAIKIRHPSQLASLPAWRIAPPKVPSQVHIESDSASADKARSWERQLTRLHSPCGCEQGAAGLLVGGGGYLLYLFFRPGGWGHPGWQGLWIGCGVVLVTTTVGKLIGVLAAQRRLRRVIREIQSEWNPQRPLDRDFGQASGLGAGPASRCCGGR